MKKLILIGASLLLPVVTFAQGEGATLSTFQGLADELGGIVDTLIPIVFALGLLVFFWGLVRFIFGSEDDKVSAKKTMLWGVVALFVMAAVWGLVAFIGDAFGVDTNAPDVKAPGVSNLQG